MSYSDIIMKGDYITGQRLSVKIRNIFVVRITAKEFVYNLTKVLEPQHKLKYPSKYYYMLTKCKI